MLAHGNDLINTWGFAYTGGVIGTFATALWLVHHDLRRKSDTGDGSTPSARLPRWLVLVGLIGGISIGLGVGRLLDGAIHDEHAPASTSADDHTNATGEIRASRVITSRV